MSVTRTRPIVLIIFLVILKKNLISPGLSVVVIRRSAINLFQINCRANECVHPCLMAAKKSNKKKRLFDADVFDMEIKPVVWTLSFGECFQPSNFLMTVVNLLSNPIF